MRSTLILVFSALLLQTATVFAAESDLTPLKNKLQQNEIQPLRELASAGKTAAAIKGYEALIKRYPQQPELYNNLAVLMARMGQLEKAREQLEQAMQVNAVYATIYENLSAVYVEMARDSYANALQLNVTPQKISLKEVELDTNKGPTTLVSNSDDRDISSPQAVVADTTAAYSKPSFERDKDILLTLEGWARAWSSQQVDLYLSFYASDFQPAQGMSRSRWERQRSVRLRRPAWVKITLNDVMIQPSDDGLARVRFLQHYQSDSYRDKTRKEIVLKSLPEGWRILSERSL